MRAALLLILALVGPAAAQDRCIAPCDEVTTGVEAAARAEAAPGVVLPPDATMIGPVEGGFQDAFVQARVDVEPGATPVALKRLGIEPTAIRPGRGADLGPPGPAWWQEARRTDLLFVPATLPGFAHAVVGVRPGDGTGYTLLIWAFQT